MKRGFNKKKKRQVLILGLLLVVFVVILGVAAMTVRKEKDWKAFAEKRTNRKVAPVDVTPMLLEKNPYSRPGKPLKKVKGIVVHYTANPGTDAQENRNYFDNLKNTKQTYVSSHFIVGLDGTVVQCVPLDEVAYASNQRNDDTISIECCHPKKNGKFNKKTYQSLVALTAWLCGEYGLDESDVIRHYDVTGKNCPKYFVEHEDKWMKFKEDVDQYLEANKLLK